MEKQQRKRIKKYISWGLIVAVVATLAFLPTIASQEEPESGPQASILSAAAQQRSISSAVLGGGILAAEEAVEITVPAAVKITDYLVSNGDVVEEGQAIATVDRVSVMTAITQVQETMKQLQEQLNDAGSETASSEVTATAGGTVKNVYAAAGETVQDVMLRDGALAVLSLDGLMAVQVEKRTSLSGGEVKRIEIATILARNSGLMILDEPEAGIDLWSFAKLTETFGEIHKKRDCIMMIISHQERIISLADEIIVISGGRIARRGSTEEIFPTILADTHGCCPALC